MSAEPEAIAEVEGHMTQEKLTAKEKLEAIIAEASAFSEYNDLTDDAFRLIVSLAHDVESSIASLLAALEDAAFDAHVASCRNNPKGTNLEFGKCTYGPCERWKLAIKEVKA